MATSRSNSPVQHLDSETNSVEAFSDETGTKLVVDSESTIKPNPKLIIEGTLVATVRQMVNDPLVSVALELRAVRKDQDDGRGEQTGILRKLVFSKNGKFVNTVFDYFPDPVAEWSAEDFGINSRLHHGASCVALSMKKKMHCICGIPKESFL